MRVLFDEKNRENVKLVRNWGKRDRKQTMSVVPIDGGLRFNLKHQTDL